MTITKFHDRAVRAPRGGWAYPIQGQLVTKYSEGELINELVKVASANGKPLTTEQAEQQLWGYFCQREPERCKHGERTQPRPLDPDVLTPQRWGPWLWNVMALAAVRYNPNVFANFLSSLPILMTCPECRAHWREVVAANPPVGITDAKSACLWVNARHNDINRRLNKPLYSYERMQMDYGAPP